MTMKHHQNLSKSYPLGPRRFYCLFLPWRSKASALSSSAARSTSWHGQVSGKDQYGPTQAVFGRHKKYLTFFLTRSYNPSMSWSADQTVFTLYLICHMSLSFGQKLWKPFAQQESELCGCKSEYLSSQIFQDQRHLLSASIFCKQYPPVLHPFRTRIISAKGGRTQLLSSSWQFKYLSTTNQNNPPMDKSNINTQLLYGESCNVQRMHWQRRVKKMEASRAWCKCKNGNDKNQVVLSIWILWILWFPSVPFSPFDTYVPKCWRLHSSAVQTCPCSSGDKGTSDAFATHLQLHMDDFIRLHCSFQLSCWWKQWERPKSRERRCRCKGKKCLEETIGYWPRCSKTFMTFGSLPWLPVTSVRHRTHRMPLRCADSADPILCLRDLRVQH